ncbi:MAG TPA: hypothetical protein VNU93_10705, partial [Verrucomicrobiae bacterium]|nr:hypothetical protein [Verrucomicrobiae bacterium]
FMIRRKNRCNSRDNLTNSSVPILGISITPYPNCCYIIFQGMDKCDAGYTLSLPTATMHRLSIISI